MADTQIVLSSSEDTPSDWTVPAGVEFRLKAVYAEFVDNGAAVAWLPTVTIYSDSQHIVANALDPNVQVTAGDDAEVSWFPGVKPAAAAAASGGAPDYILMTGVNQVIPSVVGGASGQVPWNHATFTTNNSALWTFTLDGGGNIVQVKTTQPGRYESLAVAHFDAPAAAVGETFSMSVFGGVSPPVTTTVAERTANVYEAMTGVFGQRTTGTVFFETDYSFDVATTGLVRGQWWWIKRWAL